MSGKEDGLQFETARIRVLQEERLYIQKKTFTKWMNSFLSRVNMEVLNLFEDLADGRKLLKLLEIISGEKLSKPNRGKMRVHKIENVNKSLEFLRTQVHLESIGAEDIVDGNPRLILGLIWTIILRFQIQDIEIDVDEYNESSERKSAKEALLLWCQRKTAGYPFVYIQDFTQSWRSGMGFNAIIHSYRPDLIDFDRLHPDQHIENLNNAFHVAETHFNIAKLLDAEDVDTNKPDEKSIITYVASYYHSFIKLQNEMKGGRRIANIVAKLMDTDERKRIYESMITVLLEWVRVSITHLDFKYIGGTLECIQKDRIMFTDYLTMEKPPKFVERNEIEALFFSITTLLKSLRQPSYVPPDGLSVHDLEHAWYQLEQAEYQYELTLREKLIEQERLQQVANKFERKANLREAFVIEMTFILSDPKKTSQLTQINAAIKKHEAISADILARKCRFQNLSTMADELFKRNYCKKNEVIYRKEKILEGWYNLLNILEPNRATLIACNTLMNLLREMDTVALTIHELEDSLQSETIGKHLLAVDDLLEKYSLLDSQIGAIGDAVQKVNKQTQQFIKGDFKDSLILQKRLEKLNNEFEKLIRQGHRRKNRLEEAHNFYKFMQNYEEEESWIIEKQRICQTDLYAKDLTGLFALQQKQRILNNEVVAHRYQYEKLIDEGKSMFFDSYSERQQVTVCISRLHHCWTLLGKQLKLRHKKIDNLIETFEFICEANETESWLKEKFSLISSNDCGTDELSARSLLQRHKVLQGEIKAYEVDIIRLQEQSDKILTAKIGESDDNMVCTSEEEIDASEEVLKECRGKSTKIDVEDIKSPQVKLDTFHDFNAINGNCLISRMKCLKESYQEILQLAMRRQKMLENSINFFIISRECDEVENWLQEHENSIHTIKSCKDIDEKKKLFEKLLTNLSITGGRIMRIQKMIVKFQELSCTSQEDVKKRSFNILMKWNELNQLKGKMEENLEGTMSIEVFDQNFEEVKECIQEKMKKLEEFVPINQLTAVHDAQRSYEILEKELFPLEEKFNIVNLLANSTIVSYPQEANSIEKKLELLYELWKKFMLKVENRKFQIKEVIGYQIFIMNSGTLLAWIEQTKTLLNSVDHTKDDFCLDVFLKKHEELKTEIQFHQDEFSELSTLGHELSRRLSVFDSVAKRLELLEEGQKTVQCIWHEKRQWLEQCKELSTFLKETDKLMSMLSSLESTIRIKELHVEFDIDEEMIIKQCKDFETRLYLVEEKCKSYSEMADKLIFSKHFESPNIDEKRRKVLQQLKSVQKYWENKKYELEFLRDYCEFMTSCSEIEEFLQEKKKTVCDESFRDLSNLRQRLQKHNKFESELKANENRIRNINKRGQAIFKKNSHIKDLNLCLSKLNDDWNELTNLCKEKNKKLQQDIALQEYNRLMEDIISKLIDIENFLLSSNFGNDSKTCKKSLSDLQVCEIEMNSCEQKIHSLTNMGKNMIHDNHFDSENIVRCNNELLKRCNDLKSPFERHRVCLENSLKFYDYLLEINAAYQWIEDHILIVNRPETCSTLYEAQLSYKKNCKIEMEILNHQPIIQKLINESCGILQDEQQKKIDEMCKELEERWQLLVMTCRDCSKNKEELLKFHQLLSDTNEVEIWINEQKNLLNIQQYGKDEIASIKLLKKHRTLELEMDTYESLINEMRTIAQTMNITTVEYLEQFEMKIDFLQIEIKNFKKIANSYRTHVMESIDYYKYCHEVNQLNEWLDQHLLIAKSEECGKDYEHFLELLNKFNEFKLQIDNGYQQFIFCQNLSKKLLDSDSSFVENVEEQQKQLEMKWSTLVNCINTRDKNLKCAEEIHCFTRDIFEFTYRIMEKNSNITEEVGKDIRSAEKLKRRHEMFENDLIAFEVQFQILTDDANKLSAKYSEHSDFISEKIRLIHDLWNSLIVNSEKRKNFLQESFLFQKFNSMACDLIHWSRNLYANMISEEKLQDSNNSLKLKSELEQIKTEIEAKEKCFESCLEFGETLIEKSHYAAEKIKEQLFHIVDARNRLFSTWKRIKASVDQLTDLYFFMRDAKQLEIALSSRETQLLNLSLPVNAKSDLPSSKHSAMENFISAQETKLKLLQDCGNTLIQNKHFDSQHIQNRLNQLNLKIRNLKEAYENKKSQIYTDILCKRFHENFEEVNMWIDDKEKILSLEMTKNEQLSTLEDKIKKLKRHQAFQAELYCHESVLKELSSNGKHLLEMHHPDSEKICDQMEKLFRKWNRLLQNSSVCGHGLEEAQDILDFNNRLEKIEIWIREKELMIHSGEMGTDFEHCLSLMRKLDDLDSDIKVDDAQVKCVNSIAEKLIKLAKNDPESIKTKLEELNERWMLLQVGLKNYREHLAGASEIHAFHRDLDDILQRINEKIKILSAEDIVNDLESVVYLQRNVKRTQEELNILDKKIKNCDKELQLLTEKFPDKKVSLNERLSKITSAWENVLSLMEKRKEKLDFDYKVQSFLQIVYQSETWLDNMRNRINQINMPRDIKEADTCLQLHQELKEEINLGMQNYETIQEHGVKIVKENSLISEKIHPILNRISVDIHNLNNDWHKQLELLTQAKELQQFYRLADDIDEWLTTNEVLISSIDAGDSISLAETFIRRLDAFEKTFEAQIDKVKQLDIAGRDLIRKNHFDSDNIRKRIHYSNDKQNHIKEEIKTKRQLQIDAKFFKEFEYKFHEMKAWISRKTQIANDNQYKNLANLSSKIQKHKGFEAEVFANETRVHSIRIEGKQLITNNNFASLKIKSCLDELDSAWSYLIDSSKSKSAHLDEAYEGLLFNNMLDDLESWIDGVENQVTSYDHGKDLISIQKLLNNHTQLENDINHKDEIVENIKKKADMFLNSEHFLKNDLYNRSNVIIQKFHSLFEPIQIRRENLEDTFSYFEFLRDTEDELSWLNEKSSFIELQLYGNNLNDINSLLKKHQSLENEISIHEPILLNLINKGYQFIKINHFATVELESKVQELSNTLQNLKEKIRLHYLHLSQVKEFQSLMLEIQEAETWINEKKLIILSYDYEKDEIYTTLALKKLEQLLNDISNFEVSIKDIVRNSENLKHAYVNEEADELQSKYSSLVATTKERKIGLSQRLQLLHFFNESDDIIEFISEQVQIASSEEYGRDVEHINLLNQKFEIFLKNLSSNEWRIVKLEKSLELLTLNLHPDSSKLKNRFLEVEQEFETLKEIADARQEALKGAKSIHLFNRNADETISWIQEKDAELALDDYGHDLDSIQNLVRKQEGFERDLVALNEKMQQVVLNAEQIISDFPQAQLHINKKHNEAIEAWSELIRKSNVRTEKLKHALQLQSYYDCIADLISWVNEMRRKITAPELGHDVDNAQLLLDKHAEYHTEINSRQIEIDALCQKKEFYISQNHFLSESILERISSLEGRFSLLIKFWNERNLLYQQCLDGQLFLQDAQQLEDWIKNKESILFDGCFGDNIREVEVLIKRHEDLQHAIDVQDEKFKLLNRITLIEEAFNKQKIKEEAELSEKLKLEQERIRLLKEKEKQRIMNERKQETERRKSQEIKLNVDAIHNSSELSRGSEYSVHDSFDNNNVENPSNVNFRGCQNSPSLNLQQSLHLDSGAKKSFLIPSPTSRRLGQGIRNKLVHDFDVLKLVEIKGYLERKQEFQSGRRKATVRSWKFYYTVLCGQLLCFFKDDSDFRESKASASPIYLYQAHCEKATDYTKRKNVFRLRPSDGAEYLFLAANGNLLELWISKINFHANLSPDQQLRVCNNPTDNHNIGLYRSHSLDKNVSNFNEDKDVMSVLGSSVSISNFPNSVPEEATECKEGYLSSENTVHEAKPEHSRQISVTKNYNEDIVKKDRKSSVLHNLLWKKRINS